jgi:hypothetical protein
MMTLGSYRVGLDFNPDNNNHVSEIKSAAARWIDYLEAYTQLDGIPHEAHRLVEIAQEHIETAAMFAVKAVTKKPRA